MADERQENADAKHGDRMLAAFDGRLENSRSQGRPVLWQKPHHDECQDDKMQSAVRREVCLFIRIGRVEQPSWKYFREICEVPCHGYDKRKNQERNPKVKQDRAFEDRAVSPCSAKRDPRTEHK